MRCSRQSALRAWSGGSIAGFASTRERPTDSRRRCTAAQRPRSQPVHSTPRREPIMRCTRWLPAERGWTHSRVGRVRGCLRWHRESRPAVEGSPCAGALARESADGIGCGPAHASATRGGRSLPHPTDSDQWATMTSMVHIVPERPLEQLEAWPTRRLLGRLRRLQQCVDAPGLSDLTPNELPSVEGIAWKDSPQWQRAYRELKQLLAGREHVPGGVERAAARVDRGRRAR